MNPEQKFYVWVGVVEDRKDPLKLGRCRVRIFGHHSENKQQVPTENLNWAHPIFPLNNSNPYAPKEGDKVVGFFMDGMDAQFPIMLGVLPNISVNKQNSKYGFNDPTDGSKSPSKPEIMGEGKGPYPRVLDEPSTPRVARNEEINKSQYKIKMDKIIKGSPESPEKVKTIYPYNNVYESESGHLLEFDDTPEAERVQIFHRNGSYQEFNSKGDITIKSDNDKKDITRNKSTMYVGDDLTVIVKGDVVYQVDGDFTVSSKNFNVLAKDKNSQSAKTASFSSKAWTSIGALGYLSMSGKAFVDLSSWGPTKINSKTSVLVDAKAITTITAPIINIGALMAAGAAEVKEAVSDTAKESAKTAADVAAKTMAETGGSFFTGLKDLGSSVLDVAGETFSQTLQSVFENATSLTSITPNLASLGEISSFSDLAKGVSGVLEIGAQGLAAVSAVQGAIADPLGSVMNLTGINDLDSAFQKFGPQLTDFPGYQAAQDSLKKFDSAKQLYQEGMSIYNDPVNSLSKLAGAADIMKDSTILNNIKSGINQVETIAKSTQIGQTFQSIRGSLSSGLATVGDFKNAIQPSLNSFVSAARGNFELNMPKVDGINSVMDRVEDAMATDERVKDGIASIIQDGIKNGATDEQIQTSVNSFLSDSFSNAVSEEMSSSPITLLNLTEDTQGILA